MNVGTQIVHFEQKVFQKKPYHRHRKTDIFGFSNATSDSLKRPSSQILYQFKHLILNKRLKQKLFYVICDLFFVLRKL